MLLPQRQLVLRVAHYEWLALCAQIPSFYAFSDVGTIPARIETKMRLGEEAPDGGGRADAAAE